MWILKKMSVDIGARGLRRRAEVFSYPALSGYLGMVTSQVETVKLEANIC